MKKIYFALILLWFLGCTREIVIKEYYQRPVELLFPVESKINFEKEHLRFLDTIRCFREEKCSFNDVLLVWDSFNKAMLWHTINLEDLIEINNQSSKVILENQK